MNKPYVLLYCVPPDVSLYRKNFECALDMDEFINNIDSDSLYIHFAGKIDREIDYKKKYVREIIKEEVFLETNDGKSCKIYREN